MIDTGPTARGPDRTPRVRGNDWSILGDPPADPTLHVTVVMPAYQSHETLDVALAGLAGQTYPSNLLELVVVDDGSSPPLRLPEIRPEHTRLVRAQEDGWGRAHACHTGALVAEGDVIHWLDADMVAFPDEVAAHARWQQTADYVVTIGYKRFVEPTPLNPAQIRAATSSMASMFATWERHDWVEDLIDGSDALRAGDHTSFRAFVGASGAVRRDFYLAAGGMDTMLRLGEDSELGYRLAQAGAVFVPVQDAISWHLGASTAQRDAEAVKRYNAPFVTDRMPLPRYRRHAPHRSWSVPLVDVVLNVADTSYEQGRASADALLASTVADLRVTLVAPWELVASDHRPPLADPRLDLRLIREHIRGEPRVRLLDKPPDSVFPAAFRIELDPRFAVRPGAVKAIIDHADKRRLGLLRLDVDGVSVGRLVRTAAWSRARRVAVAGEDIDAVLGDVWGSDVLDLSTESWVVDQRAGDRGAVKALARAADDADVWREEASRQRDEAVRWKREALRRGYGRSAWRWIPTYVFRRGRRSD
jgi:GT2 family glycosyltransferase